MPIKVKLLDYTPEPERVVAMAAQIESESRLPYLSGVGEGIIDPIDAVLIAA